MHLENQWNSEDGFIPDHNLIENLPCDPATILIGDSERSADATTDNFQLVSPGHFANQASIPLSLLEKLTKVRPRF